MTDGNDPGCLILLVLVLLCLLLFGAGITVVPD